MWVEGEEEVEQGVEKFQHKKEEREFQYKRGEEGGVKGVKLPTFYGRSDPEEYLQYESKIEYVFYCNNFSKEIKLKLSMTEFCDYVIMLDIFDMRVEEKL